MPNIDSNASACAVALLIASAVCLSVPKNPLEGVMSLHSSANAAGSALAAVPAQAANWAASATGRIEPKDGQIMIASQVSGRVADVAVKSNDTVQAGDLLVRLDDEDLTTRAQAASIEVQVRERERDEEVAKGAQLERRQAEDSLAIAERGLFRARAAFDEIAAKARTTGGSSDLDKARFAVTAAKEQLTNSRSSLSRVAGKEGMPLATRVESSLASSRAELSMAEAAVERTRIRAPVDGSVLSVYAKAGELVAPSPDAPLVVFGDIKALRVRAEVEERDAIKIRLGQRAVVKGDAFPDQQFEGIVTQLSQTLAAPRMTTRGVRRPSDVEVLEVMIALDGRPPLLSGMRVDVFFKAEPAPAPGPAAQAAPAILKTN
jgi:HlyD family secretion protein